MLLKYAKEWTKTLLSQQEIVEPKLLDYPRIDKVREKAKRGRGRRQDRGRGRDIYTYTYKYIHIHIWREREGEEGNMGGVGRGERI